MTIQAYQFAGGYGTVAVPNPPIQAPRDPATTDIVSPAGNPYQIGQYWQNTISGTVFFYIGHGLWETVAAPSLGPIDTVTGNSGGAIGPTLNNVNILGAGALAFAGAGSTLTGTITPGAALISTITGDSGGALSPTAGNFNLLGTANQIKVTGAGSTETFSVPTTFIAPGSIASTSTITAATGLTVTAGGAAITGTTGINITGAAVTTIGTGGTGAVKVGNATGNTQVTGSVTTTTTLTATLGNITATNGNFVASTAGNGLVFPVATGSGASSGTVNSNGRQGSVTFTGPSIAGGAVLGLTMGNTSITGAATQILYTLVGATTGAALTIQSVVNSASTSVITIANGTGATTTTADITLNFLILN